MKSLYEPVAVRHVINCRFRLGAGCLWRSGSALEMEKRDNVCLTGSHNPGQVIEAIREGRQSVCVKSKYPDRDIFRNGKRREKLLRLLWYDREGRLGREENDREDFDRDLRVK